MDIPALKDSNFEAYIETTPRPVLVTFITRASRPASEQLATTIDLAASYEGVISFAIVNAEESPELTDKYGILSVPTSVLFNGGKVADRFVGLVSKSALSERLDEALRNLV